MKRLLKIKFPFKSSGCSNEIFQVPRVEVKISNRNMSNDKNYFDTEGVLHNQFLDFFIKNTHEGKVITGKELRGLIASFYTQNNMPLDEGEKAGYRSLFNAYAASYHQTGTPVENHYNQFPCFIEKAFNPIPVDILLSHDEGSATEHTLEFIEKIKAEESKLIKLSGSNKGSCLDTIFCYYSVARYAAGYWHNRYFFPDACSSVLNGGASGSPVYPVYRSAAGAAIAALIGSCRIGVAAGIAGAVAAFGASWQWK